MRLGLWKEVFFSLNFPPKMSTFLGAGILGQELRSGCSVLMANLARLGGFGGGAGTQSDDTLDGLPWWQLSPHF